MTLYRMITLLVVLAAALAAPFCGTSGAGPSVWGFALDGYPITRDRLKTLEAATGLSADMIVFFLQWPSPEDLSGDGFPRESLEAITASGALPCITWEPMYVRGGKEVAISHADILGGRYDGYIEKFAREAGLWKKPVLIRFAHEMNLSRYHWGTTEVKYGPESPRLYREIYRHVVDIFRKCGARNVLWVFCPNAEAVPDRSYDPSATWNELSRYYPGDDYVDILGIDGYNWGNTRTRSAHGWDSRWKSFREIFEAPVSILKALGPCAAGKPLVVFETATVAAGGDKNRWIEEALPAAGRLGIDGIVWFQSDKEVDWRIDSGTDGRHVPVVRDGRGQGRLGEFLEKRRQP